MEEKNSYLFPKPLLLSIINKYYLGGHTKPVIWEIKDEILNINFNTINEDLVGNIKVPFKFKNTELVFTDTHRLLKVLGIMSHDILLEEIEIENFSCLKIADSSYEASFPLSDPLRVPKMLSVNPIQEWDINFELNVDEDLFNISKIYSAIDSDEKSFLSLKNKTNKFNEKVISFNFGNQKGYSTQIYYDIKADINIKEDFNLKFDGEIFKELLNSIKDSNHIRFNITSKGLMNICCNTESNLEVNYYLLMKG